MRRLETRRVAVLLLLYITAPAALPGMRASPRWQQVPAATVTIHGRVTAKETSQPIPSAQVSVSGTRFGAITNNNGDYRINGVPAGTVSVRVTRIGYQAMSQNVVASATGEIVANFALEQAATKLEDVITTATGEQTPSTTTPTTGEETTTTTTPTTGEETTTTITNELTTTTS
jgi:hypothetical protein